MKPRTLGLFSLLVFLGSAHAQTPASFRVLLGITDTAPTRWDGTITVKQAGEFKAEGWRFEGVDNIDGRLFHLNTHPGRGALNQGGGGIVANGFIITADAVTETSEFSITTAQGDFTFRAAEVPYGPGIYRLGGRVHIDRVSAASQLTSTPDEEDYPATATTPNGDVWLVYVKFTHNPNYLKFRVRLQGNEKDFSKYAEPTGGDQIWARKFSNGTWGQPIAITKGGGDLYRPAAAADGNGRLWIFWSENRGGNFDIFARTVDDSGPKQQVQISRQAGSDIDPAATTDSKGTVWVAWQGWRDGRAAIFASRQNGSTFTEPAKISNSDRNEWDPAIAADKTGRVAIAWDSYRNGNYDVYGRIWSAGAWGNEVPIAATARYEAYPSIAFDPNGRLWVAYEEGGRGWGKDYGTTVTTGVALYQGRVIKLIGLEPDGRLVALDTPVDGALLGTPGNRVDRINSQADAGPYDADPQAPSKRTPDASIPNNNRAAKNSLPRLKIDNSARFWLAFRSAHPTWVCPIGTVWSEYLISFDGKDWSKPVYLNHTDNLLDNRPALALLGEGKLLVVNSADGRRNIQVDESFWAYDQSWANDSFKEPYNNDLWSHQFDFGPGNQVIEVSALGPKGSNPDPRTVDSADAAGIKSIRDFRGGPGSSYRIVRGEFHRHSEISRDGGNDGTLLDQWRYALDTSDLDWIGCCDHDNGHFREYSWWITQKLTDVFYSPGKFVPLFSYERSVLYPEGHRNVLFAQRGIRSLPRYPLSDENVSTPATDTSELYAYLKQFHGVTAAHSTATSMGTDWRNNDPDSEPVVEIYQGLRQNYEMEDAPRAGSEKDAIGNWRPKGFVNLALNRGYRLGFEASSDHVSTHISYANVLVEGEITRESVLDAFRKRHVYASTDNILADVESGSHLPGDEFSVAELPTLRVKLIGTSSFAKVVIVRDGQYLYSVSPNRRTVDFSWRDNQPNKGKTSYYYVRGEQDNGELVWVSPFWITYKGN